MLFEIQHEAFVTDHIGMRTTVVEADTPVAARVVFNALAANRRDYPYIWSDAKVVAPLVVAIRSDNMPRAKYSYAAGGYYVSVGCCRRWVPYTDYGRGRSEHVSAHFPGVYEQGDNPREALAIFKRTRDELDEFLRVATNPVALTAAQAEPYIGKRNAPSPQQILEGEPIS